MIRNPTTLLAATLLGLVWPAPAAAQAECGGEPLCNCIIQLGRAVEGEPVDVERLRGGLGQTAIEIFQRGGSQNIPVVCNAAKYYTDHDPSWFLDYLRIQADPQPPGFLGTEVLSPLYMQSVLGSMLAVRAHAVDRGHVQLVATADHWLKAVWALMALSTAEAPLAGGTIVQRKDEEAVEPNRAYTAGVSVPAAGSRANRQGNVGMNTLLHPFMSLALDWKPRRYTANLRLSPGFYGGLLIGATSLGFRVDQDGRVDLGGFSPPPERLGLTAAEQQTLARFVASDGRQGLSQVLALLGDRRPSCEMTFLRTTEGLTSWFGTSKQPQRVCNRNKGPLFAARYEAVTRHATWLHPTVQTNPAESGQSFRREDQICARLEDGTERCIDIVGGTVIYEVAWTKGQGAVVVDGIASAPAQDEDAGGQADAPVEEPPAEADDTPTDTAEDADAEEPAAESADPVEAIVFPNVRFVGPTAGDSLGDADSAEASDAVDVPDASTTESERPTVQLPLWLHIEGTAEGGKPAGTSATCLLDLDVELIAEIRNSEGLVEYAGVVDGKVSKSVLQGEAEALSYAADVDSLDVVARVWRSGEVELVIPAHLESENRFLHELGSLRGGAGEDGAVRGEWTCAPFDVDPATDVVDASVAASGSWQLDPI
ncbi:MAG: hypothetical protein ACRD2Z_18135 [Thermoanaerobaculia bacterium]